MSFENWAGRVVESLQFWHCSTEVVLDTALRARIEGLEGCTILHPLYKGNTKHVSVSYVGGVSVEKAPRLCQLGHRMNAFCNLHSANEMNLALAAHETWVQKFTHVPHHIYVWYFFLVG